MLDRQVEVGANVRVGGHGTDKGFIYALGVPVKHANPGRLIFPALSRGKVAEALHQSAEGCRRREVHAVRGGVLGHQHQFLHPGGNQLPGFGHHVPRRPAFVGATQLGDDAVGAVLAAAFGDLEISHVGGGKQAGADRTVQASEFRVRQDGFV